MKRLITAILLAVCTVLTGCGTVHTLAENKYNAPQNQYWVYGGIRMDRDFVAGPSATETPD